MRRKEVPCLAADAGWTVEVYCELLLVVLALAAEQ
jgi:hypothetical protein